MRVRIRVRVSVRLRHMAVTAGVGLENSVCTW